MIPVAVCPVKAALYVFIVWINKKTLWQMWTGIIISRYNLVKPGELQCWFSNRDKAEKSGTD
jgi:hypothetical protein